MASKSSREPALIKAVRHVIDTGPNDDLRIECGNQMWFGDMRVYNAASEKLEKAIVHGNGKATITFVDHDPETARLLHRFLIRGDYTPIVHEATPEILADADDTFPQDVMVLEWNNGRSHLNGQLIQHARVFRLADEFGVESLKETATMKFSELSEHACDPPGFEDVVREVYMCTGDGRLRKALGKLFVLHIGQLMGNPTFMDALKEQGDLRAFLYDKFVEMGERVDCMKRSISAAEEEVIDLRITARNLRNHNEQLGYELNMCNAELLRNRSDAQHARDLSKADLCALSVTIKPLMVNCMVCADNCQWQRPVRIDMLRPNALECAGWEITCGSCGTKLAKSE